MSGHHHQQAEETMYRKRGLAVLILTFVAVLLGGAAIAGVGALSNGAPSGGATPPQLSATGDTEEAAPKTTVSETPKSTITIVKEKPAAQESPSNDGTDDPAVEIDLKFEKAAAELNEERPDHRLDLVILSPENETRVTEPLIRVKGLTHPRATVMVGRQTAEVGPDGVWFVKVELEPGENRLQFVAELGDQRAEAGLLVTYQKVVDKRFTAHQKWEAGDGNPTHNLYYGTGVAGTGITVRSDYGGGTTKVNQRGNWEIEVRFLDAPCNEWFKVHVSAATGQSKDFRMKRLCRTEPVFTAHQRWEAVDGEPVVNHYYGTAKPNAEVWVGSDYGSGQTTANDDGKWELRVEFPKAPCNEPFRVAAESGDARKEFKMKRVCERDHVFAANQRYGSCGEAVPYDVFWGTGIPGTTINVRSDFGGGTTAVNEQGKWELEVKFPDAPPHQTFKVLLTDGEGGEAVFEFTNTGGGDA
jgi:hypothetical protein